MDWKFVRCQPPVRAVQSVLVGGEMFPPIAGTHRLAIGSTLRLVISQGPSVHQTSHQLRCGALRGCCEPPLRSGLAPRTGSALFGCTSPTKGCCCASWRASWPSTPQTSPAQRARAAHPHRPRPSRRRPLPADSPGRDGRILTTAGPGNPAPNAPGLAVLHLKPAHVRPAQVPSAYRRSAMPYVAEKFDPTAPEVSE